MMQQRTFVCLNLDVQSLGQKRDQKDKKETKKRPCAGTRGTLAYPSPGPSHTPPGDLEGLLARRSGCGGLGPGEVEREREGEGEGERREERGARSKRERFSVSVQLLNLSPNFLNF